MTKIEISHKTIFFIAAFIAFLWLVFQIKDILFLLFVAFVLMSGLRPLVDFFERLKVPRGFAIVIVYFALFISLGAISSFILPPLISETVKFATQFSSYIPEIIPQLKFGDVFSQLGPISQNIFKVTLGVFSNIITLFMLLVFTFYLLLERKNLTQFLHNFVGKSAGERIKNVILKIEQQLGGWIRGQLALMLLIGVVVYIGLLVLRVPFALPLAIIAGLFEVVPNIGPIVSAIPALIVTWAISANILLVLAVASLYFIIQQLENSIVVPMIMRKVVGLPPLVTIIALLVGGRLSGIFGVLFAVPFVVIVQAIIQEFWIEKRK